MSSFAATHVHSLLAAVKSVPLTPKNEVAVSSDETKEQSSREQKSNALLHQLNSPFDKSSLRSTLLELYEQSSELASGEEFVIRTALERRIVVGLYAEALDQWLQEARETDSEAEWWDAVSRSLRSLAWYLLATLPERVMRGIRTILAELRAHNIPIRPSSFSPRTLRELFPTVSALRPTALGAAFFPHLNRRQRLLFSSPLELTRQECEKRRENLIELRDERALELGQLLLLKSELEDAIREDSVNMASNKLRRAIDADKPDSSSQVQGSISVLRDIAFTQLASRAASHSMRFSALRRPSRLTLIWPRLAFIPPISLFLFRVIYNSRESIMESLLSAHDTLKGFWFGYVIEPIRDILDTVRTGGEDNAGIVNREAVRADIESLERMAIDLGRDELSLNETQLQQLTSQIHQGDFTPVLRIYEEDIKAPVRTALTGSLVRSLLIQIQKAKVDLDQALSGIDKLLKSQELTFAFVGVAPALAIVYAAFSGVRGLWTGGRGGKRFGGRREREGAWLAIRRVERLLIISPNDTRTSEGSAVSGNVPPDSTLPHLTSGLLLIAVARLREFAETRLPSHSLMRAGMLADIADLENPELGRIEKLRIVERMWRSWGRLFGWDKVGKL
ncbi:NCA2-domain-containing protein [Fomitiporia mediterranea MF3/22]|uniref:NCA2-domain-containing protein n=1 Tax=Fomitiporia mediterranea (strain MF3/22) TaxID=694068 RepID=UPI00044086B2|nr:NCA2-domain-containing protein [Fomitiporia mediterranea MF3/22]EJC98511.1 NCA2-domain-containing protein [Fomitiporia mediterranea MF3/22]